MQASEKIGRLAKSNFERSEPHNPPPITMEEYAATCLLWAFRLFRIEKMAEREKARLFVWILSLGRMLDDSSAVE
jgi:hypothetical protein